ncbi:transposable element Tcb1 transposase [Trichonephila clavipes]|nr:transposable element Tcb1 transposase [Trichonephila clavipes]
MFIFYCHCLRITTIILYFKNDHHCGCNPATSKSVVKAKHNGTVPVVKDRTVINEDKYEEDIEESYWLRLILKPGYSTRTTPDSASRFTAVHSGLQPVFHGTLEFHEAYPGAPQRTQGTRNQLQNITEHHASRGGSIMVWAWISLGYRTDLHIFKRGSVTAVRYQDKVLEPIVRLYAVAVGPTFVLMDSNARPLIADIVDDYL